MGILQGPSAGGGSGTGGGIGISGGGSTPAVPAKLGVDYTTEVYGRVIPISAGRRAVTGVPIWSSAIRTRTETWYEYHGSTQSGQTYQWAGKNIPSRDFAISFGRHLAPEGDRGTLGILRMWANDVKIYDVTDPLSKKPGLQFTLYEGSSDQVQDPIILTDKGEIVPAYRNLIYIVFSNYDLTQTVSPNQSPGVVLAPKLDTDLKIPVIRVEFVDDLSLSTNVTTFTTLDSGTIESAALWANFEQGLMYGISGSLTSAAVLHEYDMSSRVELRATPILGTYSNLNGAQSGCIGLDTEHNIAIFNRNFGNNTAGIVSLNLTTGVIMDVFGTESTATEPSNSIGGNVDSAGGPVARLPTMRSADLAFIGNGGGRSQVLICSSGVAHWLSLLPMDNEGTFPDDLPYDASLAVGTATMEFTAGGGLLCIKALPLQEVSQLPLQDGACLVGEGQRLWVVTFGKRDKGTIILGRTQLKDFGAGHKVEHIALDPTDKGICVLEQSTGGDWTFTKFKCQFVAAPPNPPTNGHGWNGLYPSIGATTGTGQLPSNANPFENIPIPDLADDITYDNLVKYSNLEAGTLGYREASTGNFITLRLADGKHSSIALAGSMGGQVWDSRLGEHYWREASGSIPKVAAINAAGSDPEPIGQYLEWMAQYLGYDLEHIEVDAQLMADVPDNEVLGILIDHAYPVPALFGALGEMYDFRYFESEGKINFSRAARGDDAEPPVYTLTLDDLAYVAEAGLTPNDALVTQISEPKASVASVMVQYLDYNQAYTLQKQTYTLDTQTSGLTGQQVLTFDLPVVMTTSEAYRRAAKASIRQSGDSDFQQLRLPQKFSRLEPNDVVRVEIPPFAFNILIDEATFNGDWSISIGGTNFATQDDIEIPEQEDLGDYTDIGYGLGDAKPLVLDVPLLNIYEDPGPDTFIVKVGVTTFGQTNFSNADVVAGPLPLGPYSLLRNFDTFEQDGITVGVVPAAPTPFVTDNTTTIRIALKSAGTDDWDDTDADGLLAGVNAMLVGQPGRYELIFFRDVTVLNPKVVEVSGLLRGRRGTDTACGQHVNGDQVILVRSASTSFVSTLTPQPFGGADVDDAFRYQASGNPSSRPLVNVDVTLQGQSAMPWAPVHVTAVLDGSDIDLAWVRRDRLASDPVLDIPMSEVDELYDLEILDGPDIVRTVEGLTSPVYTYLSADQVTDGFGSPPATLSVRIYQVSALVGRGFAREEIVDVES